MVKFIKPKDKNGKKQPLAAFYFKWLCFGRLPFCHSDHNLWSRESVNAVDVKNKYFLWYPDDFNLTNWGGSQAVCHYITAETGFMLMYFPTLFAGTWHVGLSRYNMDSCKGMYSWLTQRLSVSSFRACRPLHTHSFCLRIKVSLIFIHTADYQRLSCACRLIFY